MGVVVRTIGLARVGRSSGWPTSSTHEPSGLADRLPDEDGLMIEIEAPRPGSGLQRGQLRAENRSDAFGSRRKPPADPHLEVFGSLATRWLGDH